MTEPTNNPAPRSDQVNTDPDIPVVATGPLADETLPEAAPGVNSDDGAGVLDTAPQVPVEAELPTQPLASTSEQAAATPFNQAAPAGASPTQAAASSAELPYNPAPTQPTQPVAGAASTFGVGASPIAGAPAYLPPPGSGSAYTAPAVPYPPAASRRGLSTLSWVLVCCLAGALTGVAGFAIGRVTGGKDRAEAGITRTLTDGEVPGLPSVPDDQDGFGHSNPNSSVTVLVGTISKVDGDTITLDAGTAQVKVVTSSETKFAEGSELASLAEGDIIAVRGTTGDDGEIVASVVAKATGGSFGFGPHDGRRMDQTEQIAPDTTQIDPSAT